MARIEWRLRMVAAERGIWTPSQLREALHVRARHPLSTSSVAALMRETPRIVKVETLRALCVALDCEPGDLLRTIPDEPDPG
jgi:DNA-binding Xre family transcriptional regulator